MILGRTGVHLQNHHHHHPHQEGEQGPVCAKPGYHEVVHKHPRGQVPKKTLMNKFWTQSTGETF